jgi:hypothetical protein
VPAGQSGSRRCSLVLFRYVLPLAIAAAIVACGGDGDRPRSTQISQVNTVIDAVVSGDRDAIRELLQFTSLPCTDATGAGGDRPRCLGEPAGTDVDVFQANACEPGWLREGDIEPMLDDVIALKPVVYAAFRSPEDFYLEGRYAVIFEGDDPRVDEPGLKRYLAVGVEGDFGEITGVAFGCGVDEPVHFLLPHLNNGFDDWLIEPD